jgi:hypothetical protein
LRRFEHLLRLRPTLHYGQTASTRYCNSDVTSTR